MQVPISNIVIKNNLVCNIIHIIYLGYICFRNILEYHLKKAIILEESNQYGGILSSQIMDINFDSKNEILIGTKEKVIYSKTYFTTKNLNNKTFF